MLPWKRFQLRTSTRLSYFRCASSLPTLLRSRPGTTTSWLRRSGAPAPTSSSQTSRFRFGETPAADGYRRTERWYPLSSRLFKRSRAAAAAEGGRAPRRDARARARARRRAAPAVAGPAAGRRAPAVSLAVGLHGARPAAAAHGLPHAISGAGCWRASTGWSCTPSAAGRPWPSSGSTRDVIPHPVYPSAATRAGRRGDDPRARRDPSVQGARRRDRGDTAPAGRAPARRRRPGDAARRPARGRRVGVAPRLPPGERARPCALGGDGRGLPVPRRARPVGRAPAGARRRGPRRRLRRGGPRRAGARPTAPGASCRRATSTR